VDRLKSKTVMITGAGAGIGQATALRCAEEGAAVAVLDLNRSAAEETVAAVRSAGGTAVARVVDVTVFEEVSAAVAAVVDELGDLDGVVNNAGIDIFGDVEQLSEEDWDRQIAVNLKSAFLVTKAVWPYLQGRGGGCILNTASVAALRGIADNVGYCVSKAGMVMLTKCSALSGAPNNIRVNCVCPGFTSTAMIQAYFEDQDSPDEARQAAQALHPLGRFGETVDIANAFVYLASDEAAWVTGSVLTVDGGLTCGM
jgi:meso-butanediol dehydrogenase/(S,S)-butanediol dehydrogenase/diacetyl reductase